MAAKVSLINVGKDLWAYLCRQIPPPVALSNYTDEYQLSEVLREGRLEADVIVLGHHMQDPIKMANWIKTVNPNAKIFLLRKPSDYQEMLETFSVTPALGDGISLCSTADLKTLPSTLIHSAKESANDTNIGEKPAELEQAQETTPIGQPCSKELDMINVLLDGAGLGLLLLDRSNTIAHINHYTCDLLQISYRETLGTPISFVFQEDEQAPVISLLREVRESGKMSNCMAQIRTIDGRSIDIHCSAILQTPNDLDSNIALLIQDRTEILETNSRLEEERLRNRVTLELLREGVIITDNELRIEHMNPVAESLTGWPLYEALGQSVEEIVRIIDTRKRERVPMPGRKCLDEKRTTHLTDSLLLVNRLHEENAAEITISPRTLEDGSTQGAVIILKDLSETHRLATEIRHRASHDALTGLLNRQEFELQLEKAISSASLHNVEHVLCYIDINQFKIINTQAGHTAGDVILKEAARVMQSKIRSIDILGRLGGDEFALLLINHSLEQAQRTTQSIMDEFQQRRFTWQDQQFELGMSLGMVTVNQESAEPAQMLTRAELACFTAKDRGHNRIHVYRSDDDELTRRHTEILRAAGITGALQENRFKLYCQPIISLSSQADKTQHYELLLRLSDGKGNIIMPASFIPAAERYGLMTNVDRWVIHTALHRYHETFGHNSSVHIAINLSGNSLNDDTLLDFIKQEFRSAQIDPSKVCFEITETAAINNLTQASLLIMEVKALGCQFALDDFGSGLSSFTYLKNLPVDFLKIDGSFVHDMVDDTIDHAMVEAINQLGHVMGIGTIAECAESDEVVDRLRKLGVDFAQGYAIGSPMPMDGLKLLH